MGKDAFAFAGQRKKTPFQVRQFINCLAMFYLQALPARSILTSRLFTATQGVGRRAKEGGPQNYRPFWDDSPVVP